MLGNAWVMAEGEAQAIRRPDAVLVDIYNAKKLDGCRIGDQLEINNRRARVVGMTKGIVGFTTNPYVFTTLERARSRFLAGIVPAEHCSYFLVKARPGTNIRELCSRIAERVPELDALDRSS
jgi:putative ABC transport system permease protein